jgi:hypothetical protein
MKRIFNRAGRLYIILNILFISLNLYSQEWVEFYTNTRSLGMGGAGVAVSSDETALFRNPANLGSVRSLYGTAIDPEFEATGNFTSDTFSKILGKAFDISETASLLDLNREKYYHAKFQLTPSFVRRNFGVGLIYRNQIHAETEVTGTTMDTFYQSDMGIVLGANYRFFDGIFKVGVNAKLINRIEVNNPTLSTAGPFDLDTIGSEGTGVSYDGAIMIQSPTKLLPTLGVVVHDVGNTKFELKDGLRLTATSQPADVKQSVDVGISISPIHSNQLRSVWTLEYTDVGNSRLDDEVTKRTHFGFETNYRDILFFRAGVNQRYWTAGFEVASEKISWQISSYGEEIGKTVAGDFSPREDRRYNMKITVRF